MFKTIALVVVLVGALLAYALKAIAEK